MKYHRCRKSKNLPVKRIFHLIPEGTKTEPQYFSMFRSDNYVIKIHKNRRNETSPKGLIKRANSVEKENRLSKIDQIWIISDKDNWTYEHFKSLKAWSDNVQHNHALSNPSFEYWLLLHFEDKNIVSQEDCLNHLKRHIPNYDKNLDVKIFTPELIAKAVERARKKIVSGDCFNTHGSTVYKLVEILLAYSSNS
ncbi:MAG: RloB domain-containing protein [Alphaproteobacteria bacterium]|nr:RloB domain-containing protein [Alphaproteobacteria bacterium]